MRTEQRMLIEREGVWVIILIFGALALFTGWFALLTGEEPPSILYMLAAIMGIVIFIYSIIEFHGEVKWSEYSFLVLPFLILIITIPLNWINGRELLPQSTASVINYLTIILLLGTILKKKQKRSI